MDDAIPILEYLPNTFKNKSESDYIAFLWETFESNFKNDKYQFAILAYHMLYISFVYFSVWQIKNNRAEDFSKSLVGFSKDDEKGLVEATSPFSFWMINEARIFRFLKLIGCDNSEIGRFAKLVQLRNDIAHPNGNIFFSDQTTANLKISDILRQMEAIQNHMQPVIHDCLKRFLLESWNPESREYEDPSDQIREVLIHANYLSQKDIEACINFDISALSNSEHYKEIKALFEVFTTAYRTNES